MKSINYIFLSVLVTFLFAVLITTNSQMALQTQTMVYATSSDQQQEDSQEQTQTSSDENADDLNKVNDEAESSQETTGSDQSRVNSKENLDNEFSLANQDNSCPDTSDISNNPFYIGRDGCQYPCPSPVNNGQGINPQSCPVELPSQSPSGFSINEERPIQSQQPLQITDEPQQNIQTNPSQNKFVSPKIGSDTTTSNIPTTETTSTTQKSFNPAGQFKPGSGQTESSITSLSNNFSKPFTPGAGNAQVEGFGLAYLTVYPNFTYTGPVEICVFTTHPYEVKGNPYCIEPYSDGTFHALQAPGLIGIRVSGNTDPVDTSNCEFPIYPKQSKSCILNSIDSPFIKSKSETTEQDRTLSFNR